MAKYDTTYNERAIAFLRVYFNDPNYVTKIIALSSFYEPEARLARIETPQT